MNSRTLNQNLIQLTRYRFVNAYLVREDDGFTLVDTTLGGGADDLIGAAQAAGGEIRRIALTHGHGDHVGSVEALKQKLGPDVQVGVEVVNGTPGSIRLGAITANFPRGGLKVASSTWGPCGTVQGPSAAEYPVLPSGASTWLSVTATTAGECPAGLPVEYVASFSELGQTYTVALPGYVDLGSVQVKACAAPRGLS